MKRHKLLRILSGSLLLTVLVAIAHFVLPANAQATPEGDYTYMVSRGKAIITGYSGAGGDITIPDTLGGYPVTDIYASAFEGYSSLTSVTFPDSMESIGSSAFRSCTNLTSVTIPDSVERIYGSAFYDCYSLISITIPDSVKSIGAAAFPSVLTDVYITDPNAWCKIHFEKGIIDLSDPMYHVKRVHILDENGNEVSEVTLDNTVTTIPDYAFKGSTITNITIPDSVESIGNYAFEYCSSLTGVTIPDSVISIGSFAFSSCDSLESVTIGDSVESIGIYAFSSCNSLESVTIGDSVESIGIYAFYDCDRLTSVTIGDSVENIGSSAFASCDSLTDVYYAGTETQWKAINIGNDEGDLASATIHYNHIHDYTLLPATTVEPTCTETGYIEYTCVFGDIYREKLPALGHETGDDAVVTPPTCTEDGYTTSTCPHCSQTVVTDHVAALGHSYLGLITIVDPTCTEEGYILKPCTRCSNVEKKIMSNALGHNIVLVAASDPTCEKPGLSVGTACERCGLVGVAQKETAPALGGNCDYTADPTTCANCGYVRADVAITNVVLRPSCSGLYFKGSFTFGAHETASRYGIAVSLYNKLPVADDSDETSRYTIGETSVLISNILDSSNGKNLIYARPYALLEDGTYIYGDVVCTNLKAVVETLDAQVFTGLSAAQKEALAAMYQQFTSVMQDWLIPEIKKYA